MKRPDTRREHILLLFLIAAFFVVNLLFLTRFPFIHSDEGWLAGLTRNMMKAGSLSVTESFFDLKPRYPHAVKSLFHLLQMPFLLIFNYGVFSVRLLSLLGSCGVLVLFYQAIRRIEHRFGAALAVTALLACDIQFIAASHLARQEILICASMMACMLILLRCCGPLQTRDVLLLGAITGLSVGLHPNSFLVACLCGCALLVRLCYHSAKVGQLLLYIAGTGAIASLFVCASLLMDPDYFVHYLSYGQNEFDLLVPVTDKIGELGIYFAKLWHGVSGTYYVPELRPQIVIFPMLAAMALLYAASMRREDPEKSEQLFIILSALGGVLAGTVLIGRYNQTGMVFLIPLGWMLAPFVFSLFGKRASVILFAMVAALTVFVSVQSVRPWLSRSYDDYIAQIARQVPSDSRVIANLNCEFYFENGALLDWRNLAYLEENGLRLEDYVRLNKVEYLILSDELDFIYSQRPKWNIIYGNLTYWNEMQLFLRDHCEVAESFIDNTYGVRIVEEMNAGRDFTVTIYRVKD